MDFIETIQEYYSLLTHQRLSTKEIMVGKLGIGGCNPIRLQSMTNTDTMDTLATVEQCIKIFEAGGELVRITAQGEKEANNLFFIKKELLKRGYDIPLCADIHFNPKAAEIAAGIVEKVRINPGNYTDRNSGISEFNDELYMEALLKIKERITPLVEICKKHNTVIRIGSNHGSLSERIISRYGNTALGMVMAVIEFLEIFESLNFSNIVVSMKASNTKIMVESTRLLVAMMSKRGEIYPLHLGVTEAGEGDEGRIKSSLGIGALLSDGIGDTIRVSLTESPEKEISMANKIVIYNGLQCIKNNFANGNNLFDIRLIKKGLKALGNNRKIVNPFMYNRRSTYNIIGIGGMKPPVVISLNSSYDIEADFILSDNIITNLSDKKEYSVFRSADNINDKVPVFITIDPDNVTKELLNKFSNYKNIVFILNTEDKEKTYDSICRMLKVKSEIPVILHLNSKEKEKESFIADVCSKAANLVIDGMIDGIMVSSDYFDINFTTAFSFKLLQAAGLRMSKAEFISCPSCGRTQYDIEKSVAEVKSATSHLKGLTIGVMGCIVNGPGEMAGADYGYVGSGKGKITLFKGKNIVLRNIDEKEAIDKLIEIIKANGDWTDIK